MISNFHQVASLPDQADDWIDEHLRNQMAPMQGVRITATLLDSLEQRFGDLYHSQIVRFIIRDGWLTFRADLGRFPEYIRERFDIMLSVFSVLAPALPNLEFAIFLGDGTTGWFGDFPAPVFAFSKHQILDQRVLLLPDPLTLKQGEGLRRETLAGNDTRPWGVKVEKAFWRGSTTGEFMTVAEHHKNVRFQLLEISSKHPDVVDAGFTGFHPVCELSLQQLAQDKGFCKPRANINQHLDYKYLILVDGFTSPWPREFWQLHSNSTIFKQVSQIVGWLGGVLKPNVHYVPLESDLSDLETKIVYARSNDKIMESVSVNARTFASRILTNEQIFRFIHKYLTYYASFCG